MDTCFPLLQPKHHCVKVTGERPRETNQSQEWEKSWTRGEQEAKEGGEREGTAAHRQRCGEGKNAVAVGAARWKRPDLQQVEEGGHSEGSLERWLQRGDRVILSPAVPLKAPGGSPGSVVGNLAPKAERDGGDVSHEKMSSKLTQQDFFCDLERDRMKERGHSCWSSW